MSHVESFRSMEKIPFSWKNYTSQRKVLQLDLRMPPPGESSRLSLPAGSYLPLPPSAFHPESSPKIPLPPRRLRSLQRVEDKDPFLAAFIECTKSGVRTNGYGSQSGPAARFFRKVREIACKGSCGGVVENDGKATLLPKSNKQRRRRSFFGWRWKEGELVFHVKKSFSGLAKWKEMRDPEKRRMSCSL